MYTHLVIDTTTNLVADAGKTWHEADRIVADLNRSTLRLHCIVPAASIQGRTLVERTAELELATV